MSDIFISYKREEQATARKLANALESQGWSVWWDPKLRAGERFNDVIEKALKESKAVVVMWSKRSVDSLYVKDEATYALNRNKIVPVMIEKVELPFRFEGLHTPSLFDWDGSIDAPGFRMLMEDITTILGRDHAAQPVATSALDQLSEPQMVALKSKLMDFAGCRIRIIRSGVEPKTEILFEQLKDIFAESRWIIEPPTIEMISVVGTNFPQHSYITSESIASPILEEVFSIFSSVGVNLPIVPRTFMDRQRRTAKAPGIVIVLR